jgi:DNA modification methylase
VKPYYEHAGIAIYHGDCDIWLREHWEQPTIADLLLTDPPYGLNYASDVIGHGRTWGQHERGEWDALTASTAVLNDFICCAAESIIWGGNYYALPPSRCWLVWHKPDAPPTMSDCELAWTSLRRPAQVMAWSIAATNAERCGHPTQKPESVMRWCLSLAPEAQTVLDPFMGSGTTLVAAKRLGRKAIGIEREERYCEIAAKRLAQEALPLEVA